VSAEAVTNPFPGPQPYRAADRERFFGREAIVKKLATQILARTATTLHGPSGAGKSSLMQAGVIPRLIETHDFQIVRVDAWPMGEAPLEWFLRALYSDLGLGPAPAEISGPEAIDEAIALAERRSEQPILIYLDQMEQLLFPERTEAQAEALFSAVDRLVVTPIRGLQIVLSLREDYLGRFRARARDRRELIAYGFRLGPMTVAEMASAVCKAASKGSPPQIWGEAQMLGLMRDVRTPGQADIDSAEVQAAYAQIVCRALFQQNAGEEQAGASSIAVLNESKEKLDAEAILRLYLDATIDGLGDLRVDAWKLLEEHLITVDGSRTLRTETELLRLFPPERLGPVLKTLEGAAILHAEAHQGSRYFEIGHDWLARRVYEERHKREEEAAERKEREEEAAALAKEREEAAARLGKARRQRRILASIALASITVAAGAGALGFWALRAQKKAEEAGEAARVAEKQAKDKAIEASDARLMAGFRELRNSGDVANGMKLLGKVQKPDLARGWISLANDALQSNALEVTLRGAPKPFSMAAWSPDGKRVAAGSVDGTAWVWRANGEGEKRALSLHDKAIASIAWSPDSERILTASEDGTAKIARADGEGKPVVIDAHAGPLQSASFSPNGERVVIVAGDEIARVYSSDGTGPVTLAGHNEVLSSAVFMPDSRHVLTGSADKTARIFALDGSSEPVVLRGHEGAVRFAAPSPEGTYVVTTSDDATARVWLASGKGKPVVLAGHGDAVVHAAFSPDGARVATASLDKTGRIWSADGRGAPVILQGSGISVASVAFRRDGRYVLASSFERGISVWPALGGKPLVIAAHEGPVAWAAWSPDGARALSAAGLPAAGSARDTTVKVWRLDRLEALPRAPRPYFYAASILVKEQRVVGAFDDRSARLFRLDGEGTPSIFSGHEGWITSASASPDGASIVTTSVDTTARLWAADGSRPAIVLRGAEGAVRAAAFSPDGNRVVTCSDDKRARIWRVEGGALERELAGHADIVTSAAWSPSGVFILTTSMDHTARIWRADGSAEPVVLAGHGGGVVAGAWSPDGSRIVTASEDDTAQVWSASTGRPLFSLDHDGAVVAVAWSPEGRLIATASVENGLRVYAAEGAGEPIVFALGAPVLDMEFVDDGRSVVVVLEDDTARTFTLEVEALLRGLQSSNRDCLSVEKRSTYLGEAPSAAKDGYAACEREARRAPVEAGGESK